MTLRLISIVGMGGFTGTIARYLLQQFFYRNYPSLFPFGTLAVNLLGCLLIGIFFGISEHGNFLSQEWRMFLTIGFCGGFTTFSALSYECVQLLNAGAYTSMVAYTLASVVIGVVATFLGIWMVNTAMN